MNEVKVEYYSKKVILEKSSEKIELPNKIKNEKEKYWEEVIKDKSSLFNGIIYAVDDVIDKGENILITIKETDFAHYMYGYNCNKNYICKSCWTGFIIETADNYYVFGKTSEITMKPGITHLVGGMIDNNDINNNGDVNIYNSATRELREELGISIKDATIIKNVKGTYLITENDTKSVGIVYKINLKINKRETTELYNNFVKKLKKEDKEIEFSNLEYIKKDIVKIEKYINENLHDEFIKELLEKDMIQLRIIKVVSIKSLCFNI